MNSVPLIVPQTKEPSANKALTALPINLDPLGPSCGLMRDVLLSRLPVVGHVFDSLQERIPIVNEVKQFGLFLIFDSHGKDVRSSCIGEGPWAWAL